MEVHARIELVDLLRLGMSWEICSERHVWPPLHVANAFFGVGVDDGAGDGPHGNPTHVTWTPFEVERDTYEAAVRTVDPAARFDELEAETGDWRTWFGRAVSLKRPKPL